MMPSGFEVFEHTADLGLRIWADSLDGLYLAAAQGLTSLIIENPDAIEPRQARTVELSDPDAENLFVDWLRELLFLFDGEHLLFRRFDIHVEGDHLTARIEGEPVDWDRHYPAHEVKAITYHGLKLDRTPQGWTAEVIVDI